MGRVRHSVLACVGAVLACFAGPSRAESAGPDPLLEPYAAPQTLARLPDGRRINLTCMGQGSPTVIMTAGLGDWSATWRTVQPAMATQTRVCAWDRPGFGFSDPSPEPQDVNHLIRDLDQALTSAGIDGPYVLVGHSLGGYESLAFADRRPDDVVGMVLVDPSVPDQERIWSETAPNMKAFADGMYAGFSDELQTCADDLRSGVLKPGSPDPHKCLQYPPDYSDALKAALSPYDLVPERALTQISLISHFGKSSALVVNPGRGYRDMPLVVLTATESEELPPSASSEVRAEWAAFMPVWNRKHDEIAALSTHGVNRRVEGATHYIQFVKPQAVIDAVREVVAQARTRAGT